MSSLESPDQFKPILFRETTEINSNEGSVGLVNYHDFTLPADSGLTLESGKVLYGLNIRYEDYGTLNADKSNAILVIHALTGSHHAAGKYSEDEKVPGWWDDMIGPGRAFDTNKYYVLCTNNLGGCSGTTGPNSINPQTNKPYGLSFPIITIADMVKSQLLLLDHLGIKTLYAAVGGSMGAMMATYLSVHYPERVDKVISIASTACQNAQSIAFSEVSRQAIMRDPDFHEGNYHGLGKPGPRNGLAIARMLAHITYLSDHSMRAKFGRRLQDKNAFEHTFGVEFEVESYLRYQGAKFTDRFDANSYLYLTKALNYYDLSQGFNSLSDAFHHSRAKYLVLSFSTDWLYPSYMSEAMVMAMIKAGCYCSYAEIDTQAGHDAFLLEWENTTRYIKHFFDGLDSIR